MSTESENRDNTSAAPPALASDAPPATAAQSAAPETAAATADPAAEGDSLEEVAEEVAPAAASADSTPDDDQPGREEEEAALDDEADDEDEDEDDEDVEPLEFIQEDEIDDEDIETKWYILKVQVNREDSIRDALERRVKIAGLERYFRDIIVPTEDIAEFTKTGKRRIVKKKLYPGYIMVNMAINDDTWFIVRETPGIGDFTGSAGRPAPMDPADVERILKLGADDDEEEQQIKTAIPFKVGDRVRVKEGYFQNFEGDVEVVDEANGRVTVMINIFGRSTPVELEHWQIEAV